MYYKNPFLAFREQERRDNQESRDLHAMLSGETPHEIIEPKTHRKLGRNEPCHCGSGKKLKKCCVKFETF